MLTCVDFGRIFWQRIALLTSMLMMRPLSLSKMFLVLQERQHLTTSYQGTHSSLFFHESLYHGEKLDHLLINPNQIRPYGIPFWDHPFDPMHSLPVEAHPTLLIPLRSTGTKIRSRTRVPPLDELRLCEHISMTNPQPRNPSEIIMVQAMAQGGSPTNPWKCSLATAYNYATRLEYLNANSYEAITRWFLMTLKKIELKIYG
jgi:hypothetical protein